MSLAWMVVPAIGTVALFVILAFAAKPVQTFKVDELSSKKPSKQELMMRVLRNSSESDKPLYLMTPQELKDLRK